MTINLATHDLEEKENIKMKRHNKINGRNKEEQKWKKTTI